MKVNSYLPILPEIPQNAYNIEYTVCPTRYRTRLAGGPLLRVATIRRTTDTLSHNERTPVQISLQ